MTGDEFREMALQFAGTETAPHFDRVAFKVIKRRSFATYLEADNTANIFLTPDEQRTFCLMDLSCPEQMGRARSDDIHPRRRRSLARPRGADVGLR